MKTAIPAPLLKLLSPIISTVVIKKSKCEICPCVRITAGPDYLRLFATDLDRILDIEIGTKPDVTEFDAYVEWEALKGFVSHDAIGIEIDKTGDCTITSTVKGVTHAKNAEWVKVDDSKWELFLGIKSADSGWMPVKASFVENLKNLEPLCSTDETRYVITGIFCDGNDGNMVSTNGMVLRRISNAFPILPLTSNRNLIVPKHKFFSQDLIARDCEIRVGSNFDHDQYQSGDKQYQSPGNRTLDVIQIKNVIGSVVITFTSRLIEGNFPNYGQVIPSTDNHLSFTIPDTETVVKNLRSAKPSKDETVKLEFKERSCDLSVMSRGKPRCSFSFPIRGPKEDRFIQIRGQYLDYPLSQGFKEFKILDHESPLISIAEDDLIIIMPLRTDTVQAEKKTSEAAA